MVDLAMELWSTLPVDLVERTLTFLPVPTLCRFRTVCKRWNSLICKPEFGALCIQHARRQEAGFIVQNSHSGYSLLDLSTRRWYSVKHEERGSLQIGIMAVDGGFVCQWWYPADAEDFELFVSNPAAKTSRSLPFCPPRGISDLSMVVDHIGHNYKVFVMPAFTRAHDPHMFVYESTTNRWCNSNIPRSSPTESWYHAECSVFFDGLLYVFVSFGAVSSSRQYMLWSYNHVQDVWNDTCVSINHIYDDESSPQLIVSDNRLFLASWWRKHPSIPHIQGWPDDPIVYEGPCFESWAEDGWAYEISEIHLGEKTLSTIFEMTEVVMEQLGSIDVSAIGCSKSIVLMCCFGSMTGIPVVIDPRTSLWDVMPANPLTPFHYQNHELLECGLKPIQLILPQWDRLQHSAEEAIV